MTTVSRDRLKPSAGRADTGSDTPRAPRAMTAPPTPRFAVDSSDLLARVQAHVRELLGEDDPEFTRDLVSSFCGSLTALCDRVEAALDAGDLQQVMASAHQIKGSAANVGLRRIAMDWHAVEEAALRSAPSLDRRAEPSGGYAGPDRRLASLRERVTESVATARSIAATLGR